MTRAQEIAAQLDTEWQANEKWLAHFMARTNCGVMVQQFWERREWLWEAREVANQKVREELGL